MMTISSSTVFARPLRRYNTQFGPVSVFAHHQVRTICLIRSDVTGRIIGATVALHPSERRVQEDVEWVAVPYANNPCKLSFSSWFHPIRPQHEVDNDY